MELNIQIGAAVEQPDVDFFLARRVFHFRFRRSGTKQFIGIGRHVFTGVVEQPDRYRHSEHRECLGAEVAHGKTFARHDIEFRFATEAKDLKSVGHDPQRHLADSDQQPLIFGIFGRFQGTHHIQRIGHRECYFVGTGEGQQFVGRENDFDQLATL